MVLRGSGVEMGVSFGLCYLAEWIASYAPLMVMLAA